MLKDADAMHTIFINTKRSISFIKTNIMQTLDLFNLQGKTALVTGCDTGLGMGMATALAEAGADIVGASIVEDFSDVKNAVEATGRKFTYHKVDISDREKLYAFINKVKEENKKIDI